MTIIAVGSVRGAPGATTVVCGLAAAWPARARPSLVVEADPDGGVLAARFEGLRADRTLADAAVAVRRGFDLARVLALARPLWGQVPALVAPPSADQATSALVAGAEGLAAGLAGAGLDVLVDVGRLAPRSPALPLARRATTTVVLGRPRFEDVAALAARVPELRVAGCDPALVVVGHHPYGPEEVAEAVGLPLLAALPDDSRAAAALVGAGGDRRLRRSLLWRALAELASRLASHGPEAAAVGDGPVAVAGTRTAVEAGA